MPALNLAVCWELFSDIFNICVATGCEENQQVIYQDFKPIENLNDCAPELSFTLTMDTLSLPSLNLKSGPLFLSSYLAGLIEGDGTIVVPKKERSDKGKLNYPCIQIVFHLRDFPLCQVIQKLLGHGTISKKKQSAAYILTINNLEGLIVVTRLINGKMRGAKYYQLLNLIDYLNNKFEGKNLNLEGLGFSNTPIEEDSWLAGFIEADGIFQVRASLKSKYQRVSLSFELVQSRITRHGYSMFEVMNQISLFLGVNVNEIRSDRKYPQYRIRTSTLKTNQLIRDYLVKHPLCGIKYLDFLDWCKILSYFEKGIHLENKDQIVEIKSQMNQLRTVYNWDHLQLQ